MKSRHLALVAAALTLSLGSFAHALDVEGRGAEDGAAPEVNMAPDAANVPDTDLNAPAAQLNSPLGYQPTTQLEHLLMKNYVRNLGQRLPERLREQVLHDVVHGNLSDKERAEMNSTASRYFTQKEIQQSNQQVFDAFVKDVQATIMAKTITVAQLSQAAASLSWANGQMNMTSPLAQNILDLAHAVQEEKIHDGLAAAGRIAAEFKAQTKGADNSAALSVDESGTASAEQAVRLKPAGGADSSLTVTAEKVPGVAAPTAAAPSVAQKRPSRPSLEWRPMTDILAAYINKSLLPDSVAKQYDGKKFSNVGVLRVSRINEEGFGDNQGLGVEIEQKMKPFDTYVFITKKYFKDAQSAQRYANSLPADKPAMLDFTVKYRRGFFSRFTKPAPSPFRIDKITPIKTPSAAPAAGSPQTVLVKSVVGLASIGFIGGGIAAIIDSCVALISTALPLGIGLLVILGGFGLALLGALVLMRTFNN